MASDTEILVVMSKLKKYVRETAGFNTSGSVAAALSDKVRQLCNNAIDSAKQDGRKTLMDRDFG